MKSRERKQWINDLRRQNQTLTYINQSENRNFRKYSLSIFVPLKAWSWISLMPLLYMFLQSIPRLMVIKVRYYYLVKKTFASAIIVLLSCLTYIVTYSCVIPMKAFGGISSRYKLSQISLVKSSVFYFSNVACLRSRVISNSKLLQMYLQDKL